MALIPLAHLLVVVPTLWSRAEEPRDCWAYTLAAERVRAGEPMYEPVPPGPHDPGEGISYLYPPFLAAITALVPLSGLALIRFSLLAGVVCFWIYAACLARVAAGRITIYGVLLWGGLLTIGIAALGTLYVGQIDSLIWALFGIGLAFPAARGFGFAAAATSKPFAVWPLGLAIWRERGPALIGAGLVTVLATAAAVFSIGPVEFVRNFFIWITEIYPGLAQGQFVYTPADVTNVAVFDRVLGYLANGNLSLSFLPLQLAAFAGWSFPGPDLPVWARCYLTIMGFGAPMAVLWLSRRRNLDFRYAAVMCAAVVFGPIFRATYAPILYSLVAAWIRERRVILDGVPAEEGAGDRNAHPSDHGRNPSSES